MTEARRYIVTQGISPRPDDLWFAAEVKLSGSMRRVSSKYLPLRATREEAEADLVQWLEARR